MSEGATYVNHRQLGTADADFLSSVQAMASLVPDLWIEPAEIAVAFGGRLRHAAGAQGDDERRPRCRVAVHHCSPSSTTVSSNTIETFDSHERDAALARFNELNG